MRAMPAASTRAVVARPVAERYLDGALLDELRASFDADGYVALPGLLEPDTLAIVRREVAELEPQAVARDFVMPGPDTPRVMSVLGASELLGSAALAALYVHFEVVRIIAAITGAAVRTCRHPDELMVCNLLLSGGSTHGWHLDDPPFALVVVLEAPAADEGGELEVIADWAAVCRRLGVDPAGGVDAAVGSARAQGLVGVRHHDAGDAYLLRADLSLHRVAPLRAPGIRRVALNLAYEQTAAAVYGASAARLYGGAPSQR